MLTRALLLAALACSANAFTPTLSPFPATGVGAFSPSHLAKTGSFRFRYMHIPDKHCAQTRRRRYYSTGSHVPPRLYNTDEGTRGILKS